MCSFWLNTSFLDHRYSCASPYVAQLLAAYFPADLVSAVELAPAVAFAPTMVAIGELVLSVALLAAAAGRGPVNIRPTRPAAAPARGCAPRSTRSRR